MRPEKTGGSNNPWINPRHDSAWPYLRPAVSQTKGSRRWIVSRNDPRCPFRTIVRFTARKSRYLSKLPLHCEPTTCQSPRRVPAGRSTPPELRREQSRRLGPSWSRSSIWIRRDAVWQVFAGTQRRSTLDSCAAAEHLALGAQSVGIVAGFPVVTPDGVVAETDGPPGALFLALHARGFGNRRASRFRSRGASTVRVRSWLLAPGGRATCGNAAG